MDGHATYYGDSAASQTDGAEGEGGKERGENRGENRGGRGEGGRGVKVGDGGKGGMCVCCVWVKGGGGYTVHVHTPQQQ